MTSVLGQDFKRNYQARLKHLRLKGMMLGFLRQPSLQTLEPIIGHQRA